VFSSTKTPEGKKLASLWPFFRISSDECRVSGSGEHVSAESRNSSLRSVRADFASAGGFLNTWKKTRLCSPALPAKVLGRFEHGRGVQPQGD